ncbi:Uncharacterised protein [Mycobacteroides abscessus subsp. abscessus]|nr:Uncharacterised protein [Mycobacteroides abscessus subsp. abscessus]
MNLIKVYSPLRVIKCYFYAKVLLPHILDCLSNLLVCFRSIIRKSYCRKLRSILVAKLFQTFLQEFFSFFYIIVSKIAFFIFSEH